MRQLLLIFIPLGIVLALETAACQTKSEDVPFDRLAKGAMLADRTWKATIIVIANRQGLESAADRLAGTAVDSLGSVDFVSELLVWVTIGNRPTSGYSVDVEHMQRTGDEVAVTFAEGTPAPREPVEDAETVPFQFVKISRAAAAPRRGTEVVFKLIDVQGNEVARATHHH